MNFQEKYLKYKAKYLALKNGGGGDHEDDYDENIINAWIYEEENAIELPHFIIEILHKIRQNKNFPVPEDLLINILTYNVSKTSMDKSHPKCFSGLCSKNIYNLLKKNSFKSDFFLLQEANYFVDNDIDFSNKQKIFSKPQPNFNDSKCVTYYNSNKYKLRDYFDGVIFPNYPYLIAHFIKNIQIENKFYTINYIVVNIDLPETANQKELIALLKIIGNKLPFLFNSDEFVHILIGGDFHSDITGFRKNYFNEYINNQRFLREPFTLNTCCDINLNGSFGLNGDKAFIYNDDHLLRTENVYLFRYKKVKTKEKYSNHLPMIYQIVNNYWKPVDNRLF
jgi:hypothetical protein